MATSAKGSFPGKPSRKLQKQAVKFNKNLRKHDLDELKQICTYISNVSEEFQDLFVDDDDEDAEFIGFSSEECGLCAYKRILKPQASPMQVSNDILSSDQPNAAQDNDKVVTRQSFALDNKPDSEISNNTPHCSSSLLVKLVPIDTSFAKETSSLSGCSRQLVDGAFTKYKDSKLDFHRLSKKAKNKDSYEEYTAEEQAKRKDTSTASLKYTSDIYLAKGGATVLSGSRSPIKPATFIPPPSRSVSNLEIDDDHCNSFKDSQNAFDKKRKGAGHPDVVAKALLSRASRSLKNLNDNASTSNSSHVAKASKSPHGFNLPTKSARSSRIIKANRKYMDDTDTRKSRKKDESISSPPSASSRSVVPSAPDTPSIACPTVEDELESEREEEKKVILKPGNLERVDENTPVAKVADVKVKSRLKKGSEKPRSHTRSRSFIKRARFKHPTSSDALVLGTDYDKNDPDSQNKNPIRQATFTPPTLKIRSRSLTQSPETSASGPEPGDLGLQSSDWARLCDEPSSKKWVVGDVSEDIPSWSRQEIHNVLHGAHTFGRAWTSIARHYEFHEYHRDWMSVCNKGKKCSTLGILNESYKVESSILLQLKPKLSKDPNITVFTPSELQVRGLTANVHCTFAKERKRCAYNIIDIQPQKKLEPKADLLLKSRIFGTQISEYKLKKVKLRKISKDDLYLGLSAQSMIRMMKPRMSTSKKKAWAPWEIHNILHGVHYFGIGSWATICAMYRFLEGRDNLDVRARFKSVCCRGLIIAGDVRPDVLPRLHVVLSKEGKKYFRKRKISVTLCSLSKKNVSVCSPGKFGKTPLKKIGTRTNGSEIEEKVVDSDGMTISPPRRTIHLFGSVPLWDDPSKPEMIGPDDEAAPVINALENSLRENMTPSVKSKRRASYDDVITSPSSYDLPRSSEISKKLDSLKEVTSKRSRSKSETISSPAVSKVKGPRIKHVCRRASLVTGHALATTEDQVPHLTALPQEEREKIFANSEKLKEADISSDEGGAFKVVNKIVASPSKKKGRKRHASRRCGNCATCVADPCMQCDLCRKCMDSEHSAKIAPCKQRKPCLQHNASEGNIPAKKARKSASSVQPASRKSSRLQQQIVPLVAPLITESQSVYLSTVEVPPYLDATTLPYDTLSSPDSLIGLSPSAGRNLFERLNAQRQVLIKIENWKGTYDHDLLWKSGGQPLITSSPAPPKLVCLLCGSRGHPEEETDKLIHCSSCCEVFHSYCADANHLHPVTKKAMESETWLCQRCKGCSVCGTTGKMVECKRCLRSFHGDCLGPTYPTKLTDGVWICLQCISCKSCGATKPGNTSGSRWTHNYTMCQRCGDLYDKGNYCSICQRCYNDEDYDCRMIQCAKCKRWIHSKCENLTVEMYTLLSHMPDSVQYKCPACDGRSNKLKSETGYMEPGNKTVNIDKIRNSLSRLPPPLWKKLIEQDIQSGLESIIMSLFHNEATFTVLKKNETASDIDDKDLNSDTARPRDLFAIRFAVHNHRYHSIGQFSADVTNVISSVCDEAERDALGKSFRETAGVVFSWFNFETGKIKDTENDTEDILFPALCPPHADHNYAVCSEKEALADSPTSSGKEARNSSLQEDCLVDTADLRQCIFCSHYGDGMAKECGRLLYCGQDEWTHVNCALWSAEVFEQHDGSLKNVHSAASRGKMMKCDYCRLPGATVGCNTRDCPKNYHFKCAQLTNCVFQHNKKVFCRRHVHAAKANLLHEDDFEVERLVCVDNDETRPNRCWQQGVPADTITVTIGSLTVQRLGRLSLASDSKNCLKPISYRITRAFWSTFHAGEKTIYTVTISENKSSADDKVAAPTEDHTNHTYSHGPQDESIPKKTPLQSPPLLRRTDLVERMNSDPHIGPLSPIRRIGNAPHPERPVRKGGTYTIISSINRTLPQMVTPHPEQMSYSRAGNLPSSNVQVSSSVKISSKNPFLNCPSVSKPQTPDNSNPIAEPLTSNSALIKMPTKPQSLESTAPTTNSLPTPQCTESASKTQTTPLLTELHPIPTPFTTVATSTPLSSTPLATVTNNPGISVIEKDETIEFVKSSLARFDRSASDSLTAAVIETGSTGSILRSSTAASVISTSEVTAGKMDESVSTSSKIQASEAMDVEAISSTSGTLPLSDVSKENVCVLNKTSLVFSQTSGADKQNPTKTTPSAAISLLQGARNAVNIEKLPSAKVLQPATPPPPWWKKSKTSNSSNPRTRSLKSENKEVSKKQQTPSYTPPPSEPAYWKKQGGDLGVDSSKNVRGRQCRRSSNIDYSESNYDKILEEAIAVSDDVIAADVIKQPGVDPAKKNVEEELLILDDVTGNTIRLSGVGSEKETFEEAMSVSDDVIKQSSVDPEEDELTVQSTDERRSRNPKISNNEEGTIDPDASNAVKEQDPVTNSSETSLFPANTSCVSSVSPCKSTLKSVYAVETDNLSTFETSSFGMDSKLNTTDTDSEEISFRNSLVEVNLKEKVRKISSDLEQTSTPENLKKSVCDNLVFHSTHYTEISSPEISDEEETAFPSKQLRKFALCPNSVSPIQIRSTRSRSKSYEPQSQQGSKGPGFKSLRRLSPHSGKKSRRVSDHGSERSIQINPQTPESDSARRYPRRNTYTCLKSFSGLSPNYALASYARLEKNVKKKKVLKVRISPISLPLMHTGLSPVPIEHSRPNYAAATTASSLSTFYPSLQISPIVSNPIVTSESTPKPYNSVAELGKEPILENKCMEVKGHTDDVIDTSSLKIERCDDGSESAEEFVENGVNCERIKKILLKDFLGKMDDNSSTLDRSRESCSTSLPHLEKSGDILLDADESIELIRGGDEDENPLPHLGGISDPLQDSLTEGLSVSSAAPKAQPDRSNFDQVAIPSPQPTSTSGAVSAPVGANSLNFGSSSTPPVKTNSIPYISNGEYPVLSADEVKTVLESSSNPQAENQLHSKLSIPIVQNNRFQVAISSYITTQNAKPPLTNIRTTLPMGRKQTTLVPVQQIHSPVPAASVNLNPMFVDPRMVRTQTVPYGFVPTRLVGPRPAYGPTTVPYSLRMTMGRTDGVNTNKVVAPTFENAVAQNYPVRSPSANSMILTRFQYRPPVAPIPSFPLISSDTDFGRISASPLSQNQVKLLSTPRNSVPSSNVVLASPLHPVRFPPLSSPLLDDTVMPSIPSPPMVPLPDTSMSNSSLSSLEHLIDFYSAKNKLSAEEKDIVRSIITNQINANQMPDGPIQILPIDEPNKSKPSSDSKSGKSKKPTTANKRRSSSRDQGSGSTTKVKRKRKEKLVTKTDFDENAAPSPAIRETEAHSRLSAIYEKRRLYAKLAKKPINQILANHNIFIGNTPRSNPENRLTPPPNVEGSGGKPQLIYEIKSEDGYSAKGTDLQELIDQLFASVDECWVKSRSTFPTLSLHSIIKGHAFLGLSHDAVRFLVEQLPGARHCPRYKAKYHKHKKTKEEMSHINPHGCCRAEEYKGRSKPDMFSFLASKHRPPPEYQPDKSQSDDMIQLSNRRATSMESLPMAMRFRHLRTFSKQAVGVYRSSIHGRGLYCKRDIDDGEMIMEYTGQTIRQELTDKREQHYESKSIGCYMFRMDDTYVVDATLMGSAARFINHSCEPNCYSRIVNIEGKKHIVIFALRKIHRGEELTYDYKFPIEDENHKIACNCGSRLCRKFMN